MLEALKDLFLKLADDIDTGNSNIDEHDCEEIIRAIRKYARKDGQWSKYQAYTYLNMSRSKFDALVREGKIPHGHKVTGFKELFWSEREIRKLAKK